jgi:hypothetical protein
MTNDGFVDLTLNLLCGRVGLAISPFPVRLPALLLLSCSPPFLLSILPFFPSGSHFATAEAHAQCLVSSGRQALPAKECVNGMIAKPSANKRRKQTNHPSCASPTGCNAWDALGCASKVGFSELVVWATDRTVLLLAHRRLPRTWPICRIHTVPKRLTAAWACLLHRTAIATASVDARLGPVWLSESSCRYACNGCLGLAEVEGSCDCVHASERVRGCMDV